MKRTSMLLATLILLVVVIPVATGVEFDKLTLEAKDIDCTKCHPGSPHTLHEEKMKQNLVTCEACHGAALEIAIPQCEQCHYGSIHDVHIKKVQTEDCSYCHGDINTHHNSEILDITVCAHCHRDLVDVHQGCEACHLTAPNIVKPVQPAGMTILCEACHTEKDLVHLHGEENNTSICYMCHRPEGNKEERDLDADIIPHLIHLPDLASCEECHMPEGNVLLPKCSNCHDLTGLHLTTVVPGTQRELHCSVCHPETSATVTAATTETAITAVRKTPDASETTDAVVAAGTVGTAAEAAAETEAPQEGGDETEKKTPGYEATLLAIAGVLAYIVRRTR